MIRRIPLRQRLFVVVVAAVVPLAIMSGIALYAGYQQQRGQAERAGLDIARANGAAVNAELRRTISVLEVLGTSRALEPLDRRWFVERSEQALEAQSRWLAITLADGQGAMISDTRQPEAVRFPLSPDPESIHEVIATKAPVIGDLVRSDRGYAFAVRVPIMRSGELRYVVTALIDPAAILAVLNTQRTPESWVVAVADGKGQRVARTRSPQQSLGTPYSPTLVELMKRQGSEGTGITYTSEGDLYFTAFTRLDSGWSIAVGLPTTAVDASARNSMLSLAAGIALSTLLGVLAALFMARNITSPMARLREAAIGLGRGERIEAPETDVQEIHDVATTLVAAAEEQSRSRAEREELLEREQEARAVAEASNRAKDEFLAMLGHELRNPLGAISNAASALASDRIDNETAERTRSIIVRQVGHLSRLTDDLLDAGRALMGKIVLRSRALDLSAVAMQSLATLKSAHRLGHHRTVEDFETVWVEADPVRLDQILCNLVVNAAKYTPDGGTIRVSVRREGNEAVISVADDGIGIDAALLPHVFDLFVQGTRDLDRSQGGLGIGLTLVRRLAELHGGHVSARSEGLNRGSEFTVRLPAMATPVPKPAEPERTAAPASRHVLVIEDNHDAREALRLLLELSGHRVEVAGDGITGLEKALALQPEIALVDVGLPGMDGYELARRIRSSRGMHRIFLVALTGYGSPEDRQRALDAGFDAHMVKPVDPCALAGVLAGDISAIEI